MGSWHSDEPAFGPPGDRPTASLGSKPLSCRSSVIRLRRGVMYPFGPEWVKHPREGWPARAEQTALAERIKHLPRQLSKSIRRQPDLVQTHLNPDKPTYFFRHLRSPVKSVNKR